MKGMVVISVLPRSPWSVGLSWKCSRLVVLEVNHDVTSLLFSPEGVCWLVRCPAYDGVCVHPLQNYRVMHTTWQSVEDNQYKATLTIFRSLAFLPVYLSTLIITTTHPRTLIAENILEIFHIVIVVVDKLVVTAVPICNVLRMDTSLKCKLCCTLCV